MAPAPSPTTLHLPRILCLHGGGTNADIFALQCRALVPHLSTRFRLVFADGPHYCSPGPGVDPVYIAHGPFRRWLRWKPDEHPWIDDDAAAAEILYAVRAAIDADPGTGEWVGLLGFSQGAKVAASLLYDLQQRSRPGGPPRRDSGFDDGSKTGDADGLQEEGEEEQQDQAGAGFAWRFAVLVAGRQPLVALSEHARHPACVNAGEVSEGLEAVLASRPSLEEKLELPTLHVHGLQDPGLDLHRRLMRDYCEERSSVLVEWDGGHRMPLKKVDVERVVQGIYTVARDAGCLI